MNSPFFLISAHLLPMFSGFVCDLWHGSMGALFKRFFQLQPVLASDPESHLGRRPHTHSPVSASQLSASTHTKCTSIPQLQPPQYRYRYRYRYGGFANRRREGLLGALIFLVLVMSVCTTLIGSVVAVNTPPPPPHTRVSLPPTPSSGALSQPPPPHLSSHTYMGNSTSTVLLDPYSTSLTIARDSAPHHTSAYVSQASASSFQNQLPFVIANTLLIPAGGTALTRISSSAFRTIGGSGHGDARNTSSATSSSYSTSRSSSHLQHTHAVAPSDNITDREILAKSRSVERVELPHRRMKCCV